jgi:DNA (cytosine-5)-methyltransferase 1
MQVITKQLKCLDLFSGAGGATRGLQQSGYHVTGVDIAPQPRYCGDAFCQGDAFEWLARDLSDFDLVWASPKCQGHSVLTPARYKGNHEIQLPRVLDLLRAQPVPFIVENVEGTQVLMQNPVMLCGSMFGLEIWRHRWFELGNTEAFFLLPPCNHDGHPILISGRGMRGVAKGGTRPSEPLKSEKMRGIGIDWMITKELDQAIPPAYSKFLAEQVQQSVRQRSTA